MIKLTNNIKSKTFKNHKLCKIFMDNLTMRFKRRFNNLALYFRINIKGNKIEYFQVVKNIGYTIASNKSL